MRRLTVALALLATLMIVPTNSSAAPSTSGLANMSTEAKAVVDFWTPERRSAAVSRELLIDENGQGFVRTQGGLVPTGRPSKTLAAKGAPIKTSSSVVKSAQWTGMTKGTAGAVTGRLYFEIGGYGYYCSASVVSDGTTPTYSLILTAAHCIEDEKSGTAKFATKAMFVPQQQGTTGTKTDGNCSNDPYGCWVPDQAFIPKGWSDSGFPSNVNFDHGFYRIPNSGAHYGSGSSSNLENTVGSLSISWSSRVATATYIAAFGFPAKSDPKFLYCAEPLSSISSTVASTTVSYSQYWLPSCLLSGGASGGPWINNNSSVVTGAGLIFSVNSWGYTSGSGMAGPLLLDDTVYKVATGILTSSSEVLQGSTTKPNISPSSPS